jgi:hypothetical protein
MKIFQSKHSKTLIEEERNLLIFVLCSLLKENNGTLSIANLTDETLVEYGLEIDTSNLSPNAPLNISLIKEN